MSAQDTVARRARATSLGLRKQPRESNCGGQFHVVQLVVTALIEETVRVSSLVESLNSRPRSYFFLRRNLGSDYLTLLQLSLNHRWLEHGDRPTRVREDARRAINWPASLALAQDARLHPPLCALEDVVPRRTSENLARQGTSMVRTVTRKTPFLNQTQISLI
jgi:hypothetical protein